MAIDEEGRYKAPSLSTAERWIYRVESANGDVMALLRKPGPKKERLDPRLLEMIRGRIPDVLSPDRPRIKDLAKVIYTEALEAGIEVRSLAAIAKKLSRLVREQTTARRRAAAIHGEQYARRHFDHQGTPPRSERILEIAEIDHFNTKIIVCDQDGNPLYSPWATVCYDECSRNALSVFLSFEPPSEFTLLECLRTAILPKKWVNEAYPDIVMNG